MLAKSRTEAAWCVRITQAAWFCVITYFNLQFCIILYIIPMLAKIKNVGFCSTVGDGDGSAQVEGQTSFGFVCPRPRFRSFCTNSQKFIHIISWNSGLTWFINPPFNFNLLFNSYSTLIQLFNSYSTLIQLLFNSFLFRFAFHRWASKVAFI